MKGWNIVINRDYVWLDDFSNFFFFFFRHAFVDGKIVRHETHKRRSLSGSHFIPRDCTRDVSVSADLLARLHLYLFTPLRDGTHSQTRTHISFLSFVTQLPTLSVHHHGFVWLFPFLTYLATFVSVPKPEIAYH